MVIYPLQTTSGLCGHGTLAAAHYLISSGSDAIEFVAKSGRLTAKEVVGPEDASNLYYTAQYTRSKFFCRIGFPCYLGGTVPISVDLEAPIDDVTGLPLIMCPDCKDGTCDRFWFEEEYLVFLQDNGYLPSASSTIAAGSTSKVPELVGKIDSLEQNLNKVTEMEKSAKNKANRGNVQLHQRTGARSYIAHRYSLRTKYNNMEPDAVDFFGECMNSPRNGRTPLANEIYERELEEGEAQKSPSKIVADSLSQISRSSTFLPNIGVPTTSKTSRSTSLAAQARMHAQFEEKLQAEREEAARKQEELQAQLQAQQAALEENQSLLRQTQEEVKGMHTKFEETNALLRAVLKLQKD
ncbi:hypothetical protein ZEAMMB73_Zm00001d025074 [Zea mays]|uniref:Uncharacterized protein n=1 Tax=Zea mays TaxID=4577 RepID=A0A1D6J4L4_MAIZE|nr:hypothetical protein ZEAMMB73_Zm00001d025074 [Zea mays]